MLHCQSTGGQKHYFKWMLMVLCVYFNVRSTERKDLLGKRWNVTSIRFFLLEEIYRFRDEAVRWRYC